MLINSEQSRRGQTELIAAAQQAEELLRPLAPEKDLAELERFRTEFRRKVDDLYGGSRKLNIGVVGQVKAGKSSFLNTLLFGGQEILPKAATPKTAALTKIEFGDENAAEIEYYCAEDWEAQRRRAASGLDDSVTRAAQELVQMVDERVGQGRLDVARCLSMGTERLRFDSYTEMIGTLNQYVGEDGIYTPLVKSVCLRLCDQRFDNELLLECSIVDTPGLNDPVVSRTARTKEFIEVCDVVFLLSRCSHFLDKSDWTLLSAQLPQGGVKRLVLIGSQLDSAVRDILRRPSGKKNPFTGEVKQDESHTDNVPKACQMARDDLTGVARKKVSGEREFLTQTAGREALANTIGMCAEPIFFSSLACNMLKKDRSEYTREEAGVFDKLSVFSQDVRSDLERMGDIGPVQAVLDEVIREKEDILQSKSDSLLRDARENLKGILNGFQSRAQDKADILSGNDRNRLEEKKRAVEKQRNAIMAAVSDVFSGQIDTIKDKKREAVDDLRRSSDRYSELAVQTGRGQEQRSYEVSDSTWYKPWTWGRSRTEWYTATVTYSYLASGDAADNLNRYARESATQIEKVFLGAVNLQKLRQKLSRVVIETMDMGDADFDANYFRRVVNELVDELDFPTIHISTQEVVKRCIAGFNGEVRDEESMQQLRTALHSGIAQLFDELCTQFDRKADEFIRNLQSISKSFQSTLLEKLNGEFDDLLGELERKDAEIARLTEYWQTLNEAKRLAEVI